jgi:hypothetical protein
MHAVGGWGARVRCALGIGVACGVGIACGGDDADAGSTTGVTGISQGNGGDDGATDNATSTPADDDGDVTSSDVGDTTATPSYESSSTVSMVDSSTDDGSSEDSSSSSGDTGQEFCDCAANTDLIYVLSDNAQLYSFDPATLQFAMVGALNCGLQQGTFSMGVDRNGIAWVMFQDSDIRTVDVNNPAQCLDPGYNPGQLGFGLFGMAFVSNSAEDQCDRLYAQSYTGNLGFQEGPNIGKLGSLDPNSLMMMQIGLDDYDGGELTGTGDGRLFMFAGTGPAKLIELDKSDASVISTLPLGTLELTNAFAFAFYGGDFYFFTEGGGLFPTFSQVTHLDYDDSDGNGQQDITVVVETAPIRIVGAGVSTCAPIVS